MDPIATLDGVAMFRSIDEVGVDFDVAIVATPTESHHEVAKALIEKGKHLLVEKPLAASVAEAADLVACADARGVKMVVGHVERFNPAVRRMAEVIKGGWLGKPIHFSFTRVGGYPATLLAGNNVVLDLAVHDIDVFASFTSDVKLKAAVCHSIWHPPVVDTAEILLTSSGPSANVHVNWVSPTKIRSVRVTGTAGVCFVDYVRQTCEVLGGNLLHRELPSEVDFQRLVAMYDASDRIEFAVEKEEPLKAQLRQLDEYLETGHTGRLCVGADGVAAVELASAALVR